MIVEAVQIDAAASTVSIAGRRFPACGLRCPLDEDTPEPPESRVLGGVSKHGIDVFVPMESGALLHVGMESRSGRIDASAYARTCYRMADRGDTMWLPIGLCLHGRTIGRGSQFWQQAEPEWLVEHIDRLSTYAYLEPEGPSCELLSLSELNVG